MLDKDIYPFFKELANHNRKDWFDDNRKRYNAIRENFIDFTADIIAKLGKIDPTIASLDARKSVFRINRDIRFSPDKTPYKTHIAFALKPQHLKSGAAYYLHIDPNESFSGGGVYAPEPHILKAIRSELYFNPSAFMKIWNELAFRKVYGKWDQWDSLKNMPKGFEDADASIADMLKNKHFTVSVGWTQKQIFSDDFADKLCEKFSAQIPLIRFLNQAIEQA